MVVTGGVLRCAARGWRFDVRCAPEVAPVVTALFGALTAGSDGPVDASFVVERCGPDDEAWGISLDDELLMQSEQLSEALHALMICVSAQVVASREDLFSVHAAAVAWDGAAVVLPGASGSGKTTLCGRLLQRGAAYLSDDSVALDPDGTVLGYARPLGFKWGTVDRFTEVDLTDLTLDSGRQFVWQVPPARLGAPAVESAVAALVVAPRFEAGAPLRTERLTKAAAAERLFTAGQNLAVVGDGEALRRVGAVVASCDSYAMVFGDARDAAAAIDELRGGRRPVPAGFEVIGAVPTTAAITGPRPAAEVSALCFGDGALLSRSRSGATLVVDGIGALLWPFLDGTRSVSDLATEAADVFGAPVSRTRHDLDDWLHGLAELGFVEIPG